VDVPRRVDEVHDVAVPLEADVLRLDRDPPLALQIHRVEVLRAHLAGVDRARQLQQAVGERRLPAVDVGGDGEVAGGAERSPALPVPPLRAGASVLDSFRAVTARVVVVGSANVDLVWHGARLPTPGETVTDGEFVQVLGGKGANQAAAAAAL